MFQFACYAVTIDQNETISLFVGVYLDVTKFDS